MLISSGCSPLTILANLYTERPGKKETSGFYELQDVNFSDFSKEANKLKNAGDYSEPISFSTAKKQRSKLHSIILIVESSNV